VEPSALTEPALEAARGLLGTEPLRALERLRSEYGADLAAAAWTQAQLRERAVEKFGPDAWTMLFTPAGLEQSTRAPVAAHRTARLRGRGSVLDLGCGIGGDLRALVTAVSRVVGVERDPVTAACAAHNAPAATIVVADAVEHALSGFDVVFADPARRNGRGRVFRPNDYSPPWPWLRDLLMSRDAAAKVAPGIPHDLVPLSVEAEWVSWEGEVKEAALWSGSLATPGVTRRATLLRREPGGRGPDGRGVPAKPMTTAPPGGAMLRETGQPGQAGQAGHAQQAGQKPQTSDVAPPSGAVVSEPAVTAHTLTSSGVTAQTGSLGRWLHEPDAAVIRAGLVAEAAALVEGRLLDPTIAYVTTDADTSSPYTRRWEVLESLPFSLKRLREVLRARGVGRLDVKKRGSAIEPDQLRRDLKLRGDAHAVVVVTRLAGQPLAIVCRPPVS
jgi:SAM-dependent methyltransferase